MTDNSSARASQKTTGNPIDRSPPIGLFLSGESFYQTGHLAYVACDAKTLKLRFNMPVYYLFSHALELVMKAFLRAKGKTANELRGHKIRHSLLGLWEECLKIQPDFEQLTQQVVGPVIHMLDPFVINFEFRYLQVGYKTLPTLTATNEAVLALITAVRPTCEASWHAQSV